MRLSPRALRVSALAAFVLAACSGSYLGSTGDGGTGPNDAAVPGDTLTIAPPDAPPGLADAGADAPVPPPASPCVGTSLFCDDFDRDAALDARWTVRTAAGPVELDEALAVSPPRAVKVQIVPGAGNRNSGIERAIDVSGNVRVTADVRVDFANGSFGEIDPLIVGVGPSAAGVDYQVFAIAIYPDRVQFEAYRSYVDGANYVSSEPVGARDGVFHKISIAFRSSSTSTAATLAIDGVDVSTRTLETEAPRTLYLQLGAPYTNAADMAATIRVDNVVVDKL